MTIRINRALLVTSAIVLAIMLFAAVNMQPRVLASVLLSGLTLGALYFMLTAGLSLIFGLMDVLNFAHGVIFMLGAYVGLTLYANPRTLLNVLPLFAAFGAGLSLATFLAAPLARRNFSRRVRFVLASVLALGVGALVLMAFAEFPLTKLLAQSATSTGGVVATAQAQEPDETMLRRAVLMLLAGALFGPLLVLRGQRAAPRDRSPVRALVVGVTLLVLGVALIFTRSALEQMVLGLSTDVRFVVALVVGTLTGALVGGVLEYGLIRPLYARPIYQVLLTLGLVFVGDQFVKLVWGPSGYFMEMPALFNGQGRECPSPNLIAWFSDHCASIDVLGRGFPSYRMFLIVLGVAMLIVMGVLLTRTRLGMIIRAGVQDAEMVEALGINVRRVFTGVFALGAALAALGGVAAAPFIGVNPAIGNEFLLQGFISVVIGGMGSLAGAAIGALLVGMARAFGDNLVLAGIQLPWMQQAISASPALARASTVLIMAIVLLLRPSGIFGKKD